MHHKHTLEQNQIDLEIQRLRAHICDLQFQRNELAPVSALPVELLAQIFEATIDGASAGDLGVGAERRRGLVALTGVCRKWRAIAEGWSGLWRCIYLAPEYKTGEQDGSGWWDWDWGWASRCLQHVGKVHYLALDVRYGPVVQDLYKLLGNETHRIKVLQLQGPQRLLTLLKRLDWPKPAIALHTLYLQLFALPNDLFANQVPALRRLLLVNCLFTVASPLLSSSNLTHIEIESPFQQLSANKFFRLASQWPNLEFMRFHGHCFLEFDQAPWPTHTVYDTDTNSNNEEPVRVYLPRLREFIFADEVPRIMAVVISKLSFPPDVRLILGVSSGFLEAYLDRFFKSLLNIGGLTGSALPVELLQVMDLSAVFIVRGRATSKSDFIQAQVDFHWAREENVVEFVYALPESLTHSVVRLECMQHYENVDTNVHFILKFAYSETLEGLLLTEPIHIEVVLQFMADGLNPLSSLRKSATTDFIFPVLDTLTIKLGPDQTAMCGPGQIPPSVSQLGRLLSERKALGYELGKLVLHWGSVDSCAGNNLPDLSFLGEATGQWEVIL